MNSMTIQTYQKEGYVVVYVCVYNVKRSRQEYMNYLCNSVGVRSGR